MVTRLRIAITVVLMLGLVWTVSGAAVALPGEGFDVGPYGRGGGSPSVGRGVELTSTGFAPSLATAVIAVVVAGVVMAIAGYAVGTLRQRRALAH